MTEKKSTQTGPEGDLLDDITGARQWRRSKLGFLTGFGAARDAIGDVGRIGRESRSRTRDMVGLLRKSDRRGVAVNVETKDAQELFETAARVNGKTESAIAHSVATTYRQFWLYTSLMIAALVLGLAPIIAYGYSFPGLWPLELAFRFMLVPLTAALAFRAAFTNWMFRRRSLDSVGAFIDSGEYLPKKAGKGRSSGRGLVAALLLATGVLFGASSNEVMAQGTTGLESSRDLAEGFFADPETDDLFTVLLSYVVPDVGPVKPNEATSGAPQYQAIKSGFFFFSATLLFIGANLIGWQILSSIVASAKEGSVMGRRYHEVWAPIRAVIGFGMLAPIAGGFCAAQVVVIYLVVWGGNLANLVWAPYIETITIASNENMQTRALGEMSQMATQSGMTVAREIVARGLCNETIRAYHTRNQTTSDTYVNFPNTGPIFKEVEINTGVSQRLRGIVSDLRWQPTRQELDYGPVCGSLTIETTSSSNGGSRADGQSGDVNSIMAEAQIRGINEMNAILHEALILPAAASYQDFAAARNFRMFSNEASEADKTVALNLVARAVNAYDTQMMTAARRVYDMESLTGAGPTAGPVETMRRDAITQGWAGAGIFYVTVARLQNAIYELATSSVQTTPMDFENASNMSADLSEFLIGTNGNGALPQFESWWNNGRYSVASQISQDGLQVANETTEFGELMTLLFGNLVRLFEEDWNPHVLNPMQDMVDMGNKMLYSGLGGFAIAKLIETDPAKGTALAGAGVAGIFGAVKGYVAGSLLGSVIAPFASLGVIISFILMAAGIVHAFVIPMIPFVMTVFFVASMLVLVVEALVAAPIWAFLHIRLDGDEFVDQVQKPGYMIAFNLILRPTLMIFGLILSMLIFGAMTFFVSQTFIPAMRGLSATNGIGFFGFVVMIVILCYLHFQTAIRAFSLILRLPDRVTRWFGQGGENLGEEQDSERTTAVLVGGTEQRLQGAGAGMGQRKPRLAGRGGAATAAAEASGVGSATSAASGSGSGSGNEGGKGGSGPRGGGSGNNSPQIDKSV